MILPFTAISLSEAGHQEFEAVNEQEFCLEENDKGKTVLMAINFILIAVHQTADSETSSHLRADSQRQLRPTFCLSSCMAGSMDVRQIPTSTIQAVKDQGQSLLLFEIEINQRSLRMT